MIDPRFYKNAGPFSLANLRDHLGLADSDFCLSQTQTWDTLLTDVAALEEAGTAQITSCHNQKYKDALATTQAGLCVISKDLEVPAGTSALFQNIPSVFTHKLCICFILPWRMILQRKKPWCMTLHKWGRAW